MTHVFSFAKNNISRCQQVEDLVHDGQRYMQFIFLDVQGNSTTGYIESYDDPSKGSLFCCMHQTPIRNQNILQMERLSNNHAASIAGMKQRAIANSPVVQRQQVDQLFLQNKITADVAAGYYQQIEHAGLIVQAQKEAKKLRKKNKKNQRHVSQKIIEEIKNLDAQQRQILAKTSDHQSSSYQQVIDQRSKAFAASINDPILTTQHIKINRQTAGFLQAQGIDTALFEHIEGLQIQHQLTHELVNILDEVAQYAQQHQYEMYQTNLTKYCAHFASLSQQSNMQGNLQQAIDGTNCCHGITHYLEGMVSGVTQAYQQFQTSLDYFDGVADTYGNLIMQHAAQAAVITEGLEAIVTAGMIAAPMTTIAATSLMIGATAYIMAPLCAQAMIDTVGFGGACITGNWEKVVSDLDNFGRFISSPQTVARMAEFAGGAAIPTPNLNFVVDQVLSLRPVITSVQNASGETVQSLYFMTKNQLQKVYRQGLELLQRPEFVNFNMTYKKIGGFNFFDILPQFHPALAAAFSGLENAAINSGEQTVLTQLFTKVEEALGGNFVKNLLKEAILSQYPEQIHAFLLTDVGAKMAQSIKQPLYENKRLIENAKEYNKLIANQASQEKIDIFLKCQEISIIPDNIFNRIEQASVNFYKKNNKYQDIKIHTKHIFYPNLKIKFNIDYQNINRVELNGFHHDEFGALEQSGLFTFVNKVYGSTTGAEECFKAELIFSGGIIVDKVKTFFSSNWSKEKVLEVIVDAFKTRDTLNSIDLGGGKMQFECLAYNNMLIDIIVDFADIIISAYPSMKNFKELK